MRNCRERPTYVNEKLKAEATARLIVLCVCVAEEGSLAVVFVVVSRPGQRYLQSLSCTNFQNLLNSVRHMKYATYIHRSGKFMSCDLFWVGDLTEPGTAPGLWRHLLDAHKQADSFV